MRTSLLLLLLVTVTRGAEADLSQGRPWIPPLPVELSAEQRAQLQRFDRAARVKDAVPDGKGADATRLAAVERRIRETWGIRREADGRVVGLPICTRASDENDAHIWLVRRNDPANAWTAAFGELTACYRRANAEQARRIEQLAADLADHLAADTARQGRPAFLNSGCLYIWNNRVRDQVLPMHAALEARGALLPLLRAMPDWANAGWLEHPGPPSDSDAWRGGVLRDVIHSVAAFPDGPEKWQRLSALEHYLSANLDQDRQHSAIAMSGEFIHHGNLHLDYAYALGTLWADLRLAQDAGIRLTPGARERLRSLARATTWMTVAGYYPSNLSLRPGTPKRPGGALSLIGLADLGDESDPARPDLEMAGLALATGAAQKADAARLSAAGAKPTPLVGLLALPQRPGLVWRRGDTVVGVAMLPADRYGFEIYSRDWASAQCRYVANGTLMRLSPGKDGPMPGFAAAGDGRPYPGWDWARFPGATACLESAEALTDTVRSPHGTTRSDAGGVVLLGDGPRDGRALLRGEDACGLIAARFDGAKMRVDFNRSTFAFGEQLLVITSGVRGKLGTTPVATTLFQSRLPNHEAACSVDGAMLRGLPSERTLAVDHPVEIVDPDGQRHLALPLPSGPAPRLTVSLRRQSWKGAGMPAAGEGDFAWAGFDHAEGRDAAAWVMRPLGTAGLAPPTLLEVSETGHAALDPATRTYAYAAFAHDVTWKSGPVARCSLGAVILVRERGPDRLTLAACSQERDPAGRPIVIRLRGRWHGAGAAGAGEDTVLTLARPANYLQFGLQTELSRD